MWVQLPLLPPKELMALKSYKPYNELDFKERFVHLIHNDLSFKCDVELKENEFHTCKECGRRANIILMFFTYELGQIRQQKI